MNPLPQKLLHYGLQILLVESGFRGACTGLLEGKSSVDNTEEDVCRVGLPGVDDIREKDCGEDE